MKEANLTAERQTTESAGKTMANTGTVQNCLVEHNFPILVLDCLQLLAGARFEAIVSYENLFISWLIVCFCIMISGKSDSGLMVSVFQFEVYGLIYLRRSSYMT